MEYDKCLISLYKQNNPLPQMFVTLYKRADRLVVKLTSQTINKGILFLCADKKVMHKKINAREDALSLNPAFTFDEDFLFCFISEDNIFVGQKGEVKQKGKIIAYFESLNVSLCKHEKEEGENIFDRNYVVDKITQKLFSDGSQLFFEQTKKQLSAVFSASVRAKNIEAIIPYSKFVSIGEENESAYVGVVYKNKLPYAIGIGFDADTIEPQHEGVYQFFYDKSVHASGQGKSFYFSFRRVSDADVTFLTL